MWKNITIGILVILCLMLFVFAFRQYLQAEANRFEAEKQRVIAEEQMAIAEKERMIAMEAEQESIRQLGLCHQKLEECENK